MFLVQPNGQNRAVYGRKYMYKDKFAYMDKK